MMTKSSWVIFLTNSNVSYSVWVKWTTYLYYGILWFGMNMVVTTRMYHKMIQDEPTTSDIDKIDLELKGKKILAE